MKKSKRQRVNPYMPVLSVRPTYSVSYMARCDELPPSRATNFSAVRSSAGVLSSRAAQRMRNAINWMLLFSHKKTVYSKKEKKRFSFVLNFITLTLSEKQRHDDRYITEKMLQPFLKWLGRNYAKMYVWRAETQANGNIHYHITTNTFIHWKSIRRKWNSIQSKHGYMKKWTEGNESGNPNSTDIHAVKNERETARYMAKYMTKNDDTRRKITGRIWGSSQSLSNVKLYITAHDYDFKEVSNFISRISDKKELDYSTLFMHSNLKYCKIPECIRQKLIPLFRERESVNNPQSHFTVESFYQ